MSNFIIIIESKNTTATAYVPVWWHDIWCCQVCRHTKHSLRTQTACPPECGPSCAPSCHPCHRRCSRTSCMESPHLSWPCGPGTGNGNPSPMCCRSCKSNSRKPSVSSSDRELWFGGLTIRLNCNIWNCTLHTCAQPISSSTKKILHRKNKWI